MSTVYLACHCAEHNGNGRVVEYSDYHAMVKLAGKPQQQKQAIHRLVSK
jgi:hypothetical protein